MKTLTKRPMQPKEMVLKTSIPQNALSRHLRKLIVRGFLKRVGRWYVCAVPRHEFARLLLHLATRA